MKIVFGIALALTMSMHAHGQTLGTVPGSFFYPDRLESFNTKFAFDVMFGRVPFDVVEEAQTFRWPLFTVRSLIGLPENFAFEATLASDFVMFSGTFGPKWRYDFTEKLHSYVGIDAMVFGGRVNQGQFNQSASGWLTYPNIALGYQFGDITLTLKGELNYLLSLSGRSGNIEISNANNAFNGFTISGYIEQPLWKDNYVILGARFNHIKFY
ncbi:MAG: hypothetical protein NTX15_03790 [Candidatus Kapabacteria bacterium]|nr:hypothetical protein [Candidatus Kapabacteria bacterium]